LDQPFVFELEPNNQLDEVEVVLKRGDNWYLDLEKFKQNFIGLSAFAHNSKILNPKVLQFRLDEKNQILYANAKAPLKIRNKALGYIIEYDLTEYQYFQNTDKVLYYGYPKFTEMEGGSAKQKKWAENRLKAYNGSRQHFFKSLYNRTTKAEGFEIRYLKRIPNSERPSDDEIQKAHLAAEAHLEKHKKGKVFSLPENIQSIFTKAKEDRFIEELDQNELVYSPYLKEMLMEQFH
jgi:hypothetical protein